jgi:Tol biopolymer transport system component
MRRVLQVAALSAAGCFVGVALGAKSSETARVISSRAHLATISVRGGQARVLSTGGSYFFVSAPRVSPGGKTITYGALRCPSCRSRLTVVPFRGGRPRTVQAPATEPAWSPDGRRLVFVKVTPNGLGGLPLYLINRSGTALQKLDVEIPGEHEQVRLFHNPVFAPSGKAIAFDAEVDEEEQVFLLDLTSHVARQLTHNPHGAAEPVFTPDGRKIVYACGDKHGSRDICAIGIGDRFGQRLVVTAGDDADPAVSPDGRRLVFSSDLADRKTTFRSLYVAPIGGGAPRRLTRGFNAAEATFSANGKTILFVRRALVRSG